MDAKKCDVCGRFYEDPKCYEGNKEFMVYKISAGEIVDMCPICQRKFDSMVSEFVRMRRM